MGVLFNDFLMEWLESIKEVRALSTYARYCQISEKYVIPYFKGKTLQEMKSEEFLAFRNSFFQKSGISKIKTDAASSDETIRILFIILNQVLRAASEEGMLREIPEIKIPYRQQKRIVRVFSEEQQRKLEHSIKSNPNETTIGMLLCLYTGLRIGELCALRWDNVNLDEECLYVRSSIQRLPGENGKTELFVVHPKSASSTRQVPIPSVLISYLQEQKKKAGRECFVLSGKEIPLDPRTMQYRYKSFLKKSGVSYLNFHTLRHTFATRCISVGMDPKTLSEILGHANIRITMEYYFHSSFEFKKKQMERLFMLD